MCGMGCYKPRFCTVNPLCEATPFEFLSSNVMVLYKLIYRNVALQHLFCCVFAVTVGSTTIIIHLNVYLSTETQKWNWDVMMAEIIFIC